MQWFSNLSRDGLHQNHLGAFQTQRAQGPRWGLPYMGSQCGRWYNVEAAELSVLCGLHVKKIKLVSSL